MYMRRALELAAKGVGCTRPNPAVGCVILDKSGEIVGEGYHPRAGEPHAEVTNRGDLGLDDDSLVSSITMTCMLVSLLRSEFCCH